MLRMRAAFAGTRADGVWEGEASPLFPRSDSEAVSIIAAVYHRMGRGQAGNGAGETIFINLRRSCNKRPSGGVSAYGRYFHGTASHPHSRSAHRRPPATSPHRPWGAAGAAAWEEPPRRKAASPHRKAAKRYRKGATGYRNAATAYRKAAKQYRKAATAYRNVAKRYREAATAYRKAAKW